MNLLVALHARKSHSAIINFRQQHPGTPIIVTLTGTDLYRDIRINHLAKESLVYSDEDYCAAAESGRRIAANLAKKTRVIYQSVEDRQALNGTSSGSAKPKASKPEANKRSNGNFDVCVIGHLRAVKDLVSHCHGVAIAS